MNLIKRTYYLTALWLLPVLILGSVFSFFMIEYINYEETDEFLRYEMERLKAYHKEHFDLPEYHKVADIIEGEIYPEPIFKDTLMLESGDNELVPYRELRFSIEHKGKHFGIVLRHLMPGRDDIAEGALLIVGGVMLLIVIVLLLSINQANRVLWKPFYNSLDKLTRFRIGDPIPEFEPTSTTEFEVLNQTVRNWLQKVSEEYQSNKAFNENASHELQTHLHVIRSNTEKLMNEWTGEAAQLKELNQVYEASAQLKRFQKSLLLLSKIANEEFHHPEEVDLKKVVEQSIELFHEAIQLRGIHLETRLDNCSVNMDVGLAEILVNNLVKNAVKHNVEAGFIRIFLSTTELRVENSGERISGDPQTLLVRFSRGKNGTLGIGLSIVQQICSLNHFGVSYRFVDKQVHILSVIFQRR